MNRILALLFLSFLVFAVVPELGIIEQGHIINTTAESGTVTVLFILNESKPICVVWGPTESYYYVKIPSTGYAILPANRTLTIESWYPFEVNGSPAYDWLSGNYAYFINFTHNTVVYINFVQNKSLMRIPIFGQPVTNVTSTTSLATIGVISPTEGITIAISSLVLVITVVIIVSIITSKRGKNK